MYNTAENAICSAERIAFSAVLYIIQRVLT